MPVSEALAYKLAFELTLIPECPQSERIIEILAGDLDRLCRNDTEAQEIVMEARDRWDRWKGPRGLIELLEAKRPSPPPSNQAKDYGPRKKPDCPICADWGYFGATAGKVEWCTCAMGLETRERFPDLIEGMNRKRIEPLHRTGMLSRKPVTQEDIDLAFSQRQDRTEQLIRDARDTLSDPAASLDRKEIAREILRRFGA